MQIVIQDPRNARSFTFTDGELQPYLVSDDVAELTADHLFVLPSSQIVESVPVLSPSADGDSRIVIRDPDDDRTWLLSSADLERFASVYESDTPVDAWFSIPDDEVVLHAIPFFRRGLVQNSS
jgi:hypothetical protein